MNGFSFVPSFSRERVEGRSGILRKRETRSGRVFSGSRGTEYRGNSYKPGSGRSSSGLCSSPSCTAISLRRSLQSASGRRADTGGHEPKAPALLLGRPLVSSGVRPRPALQSARFGPCKILRASGGMDRPALNYWKLLPPALRRRFVFCRLGRGSMGVSRR